MSAATAPARQKSDRGVVALFSLTMLVSAMLLFAVQPMVARFVLPTFGSAPSVWAIALVFFQAVLLLGYLYAHVSSTKLGPHRALGLHAVLLLAPAIVLPLGVPAVTADVSTGNPALALLGLLAVSIGLPFFVVSSTAPLLQRWLANTDHPAGRDPYFLYRASNLGSVVGLLSYPLLVEPRLALDDQGQLWTWGYAVLVVLLLGCAAFVWRSGTRAVVEETEEADEPLTVVRRLKWMALAFVPSSLIVAATSVLTTDVAPIPLLWVLPLGLYLLSFILAFSGGKGARAVYEVAVWLLPFALMLVLVVTVFEVRHPLWLIIGAHLLAVFLVAMVCHGRLAQDRPAARRLTTFYLVEASGGVLGGAFAALVAPLVFDSSRVPARARACRGAVAGVRPPAVEAAEAGARGRLLADHARDRALRRADRVQRHRLRRAPGRLRRCRDLPGVRHPPAGAARARRRRALHRGDGRPRRGRLRRARARAQLLRRARRSSSRRRRPARWCTARRCTATRCARPGLPQPTTYYHPASPIGQLVSGAPPGMTERTAVIGLGTGTMAAHSRPGERWTFYEIDPAIARVASDPRYFTYLRDAPGSTDIVLGDARLSLQEARDGTYGLIVADAFSSDAIPTHLITREALALYFRKLTETGRSPSTSPTATSTCGRCSATSPARRGWRAWSAAATRR